MDYKDNNNKLEALFTDGTGNYVIPNEADPGDTVRIRMRTGIGTADSVSLITEAAEISMEKATPDGAFDYYTADITLGKDVLYYYFRVDFPDRTIFFNSFGISTTIIPDYSFKLVPGFHVPSWMTGAVIYQIMTDRFCRGCDSNDVVDREYFYIDDFSRHISDWYSCPTEHDVGHFYGGDLEGVIQKLDYLKELGVEALYFNPLFVSPSSHKYDTQDYDYIDPHLTVIKKDGGEVLSEGDHDNSHATKYQARVMNKENLEAGNACFIRLTEEAHKRGIRIILDGVFNHCGSFNKWLDRERMYERDASYAPGAFSSADSPYRGFFDFRDSNKWPYNDSYDGWWGYDTLPKLNYENSEELKQYILDIGRKWVSQPYNADGWRLDVAADLGHSLEFNHHFWKEFRRTVKEANPDAVILAENYGSSAEWLKGDEWDTIMNYDAFMEPLTWFLTGMEKHSDDYREELYGNAMYLEDSMRHSMNEFLTPSLFCAMNELSNHDHSRFLTRTNKKVGRASALGTAAAEQDIDLNVMMEAVVVQMTWPGAPTIYYGDEAGLCGFTDPDCRRGYPWGRENNKLLEFHKKMIHIHRSNPALKHGSLKLMERDRHLFSYARFQEGNRLVVIVNNRTDRAELSLPVWMAEIGEDSILEALIIASSGGFSSENIQYTVKDGMLNIILEPRSSVVLREKK